MKVKIKCSCGIYHYIKVKNIKEAKKIKKQIWIADCCIPFWYKVLKSIDTTINKKYNVNIKLIKGVVRNEKIRINKTRKWTF